MSKKQQGAPTKTEPWTLFLGNELQDGIAAFFSSSSSFIICLFFGGGVRQRWQTFFNSKFLDFFLSNSGKRKNTRALNSGPYFPSVFFAFWTNSFNNKTKREGPPPVDPPTSRHLLSAWFEVLWMFYRCTTFHPAERRPLWNVLFIENCDFLSLFHFYPVQLITKCSLSWFVCFPGRRAGCSSVQTSM